MAWGWSQQVARPTYVSVTPGELPVTGELDRPTAACDISSVSDRTGSVTLNQTSTGSHLPPEMHLISNANHSRGIPWRNRTICIPHRNHVVV
ncbi:unnamed protein product [Boreogadus saida]